MSKIICFVVLMPASLVARSELPVERNGRVFLPPAGGWSLDGGDDYKAAFRPERRRGNQPLNVDQLVKFAVDGTESDATWSSGEDAEGESSL